MPHNKLLNDVIIRNTIRTSRASHTSKQNKNKTQDYELSAQYL